MIIKALNKNPKARAILGGLVLSLAVFLVGMLGGVWGFLLLSNTENPIIQNIRQSIGLSDNPSIPSVLTEKIILEETSKITEAAKKISPSVVSITTSSQVTDYFGFIVGEQEGGGTGFIITADGYIMTNKHVVSGLNKVTVTLSDGTEHEGTVVSEDPSNDVAVVKIEATDLPVVELGDSDRLNIGQSVIAVGNAFGEFENTVTTGVVSSSNRSISAGTAGYGQGDQLTGLIQTDAAINPGNSGGPLVNLVGQVIGMNTAIASSSGSSSGVGFAIPVNAFRGAVSSIIEFGRIVRPGLGVRYIPINKAVAERNNLTVQYGALVAKGERASEVAVLSGSPADKAGIKEGDILLEINGDQVTVDVSLSKMISQYEVGAKVSIKVLRDGKQLDLDATLEELKQ